MAKLTGTEATGATPSVPTPPLSATRRCGGLGGVEPLTSAELIRAGVSPQLLASLALRRAYGGGITKSGDHYFDHGRPTPSYLAGIFDELAGTGILALAEENPGGLRRVSLTPAGHRWYEQLDDRRPDTPFPAPEG